MLISSETILGSIKWYIAELKVKEFIFTVSLLDITIQDNNKRKRSDMAKYFAYDW